MHSITSTDTYIVLPMGSSVFDTCGFVNFQPNITAGISYPGDTPYDSNVNLRFLLFNKKTKEFIMVPHSSHYFITHQFNAYEDDNGMIIADMLAYKDAAPYNYLLMLDYIKNNLMVSTYVVRFIIDPIKKTSSETLLVPGLNSMEFSQFNHRYTSKSIVSNEYFVCK